MIINTNMASALAATSLEKTNSLLQASAQRLSSGSRINNPADNAGGLAVAMKMEAGIRRTDVVSDNISNALSFLQTQDGALTVIGSILSRMSELSMLYRDPTKNAADKANYQTEFVALQNQLGNFTSETFNGVALFDPAPANADGTDMAVGTTEDGAANANVDITRHGILSTAGLQTGGNDAYSLSDVAHTIEEYSIAEISKAIQNIATMRATNGAQASRLSFAQNMLAVNKNNLSAAKSRITDTNVAEESTQYAKYQILVQAGTAMLAQANAMPNMALKLIGG